jgi:transcriptional regulator with XRE-family HTH domain
MVIEPPRLREARVAAGLTQRALAARLGWPQPVIAKYETGVREPRVLAALRVAETLGTTVEAIWSLEPADKSPRDAGTSGGVTTSEVADAVPAA